MTYQQINYLINCTSSILYIDPTDRSDEYTLMVNPCNITNNLLVHSLSLFLFLLLSFISYIYIYISSLNCLSHIFKAPISSHPTASYQLWLAIVERNNSRAMDSVMMRVDLFGNHDSRCGSHLFKWHRSPHPKLRLVLTILPFSQLFD